ncbi:MAG: alkaline phosphatase D family protein [Bacteroidia bacterium]|nr:alkaline phosphatase D family protein [Bacteroidia bacterium]
MRSILNQSAVIFCWILLGFSAFGQSATPTGVPRLQINSCLEPFYHGVASGDPTSSSVMIWTRVTPTNGTPDSILVTYKVATDTTFATVVSSGSYQAKPDRDYTVKVDITGLQAGTFYYYRFESDAKKSLIGRTKTAPVGGINNARFAVVSCANYESGFFNVYRKILQRNDIDAVLHLGDYIYEYGTGGMSSNLQGREKTQPEHEIITLDDYRTRYSHYHLDPELSALHQQFPFITVWDDHEKANDAYRDGAQNHDSTEGDWYVRKAGANKAYDEWLPLRLPNSNDPAIIYRKIEYGDLINLYMMDTRSEGRDKQVALGAPELNDTTRKIISQTQYDWLMTNMKSSTKTWNILGQQVMMMPLRVFGTAVNLDQWDGYPFQRQKLWNDILDNNIKNIVVLTGDIHTAWAGDLPARSYNSSTGAGSAGVEFVTTSVTSPGSPIPGSTAIIKTQNQHMKFTELTKKGYVLLDITPSKVQGDFYFVNTINTPDEGETFAEGWYVDNNTRFLKKANAASTAQFVNPPLAPTCIVPTGLDADSPELIVVGTWPNPFTKKFVIQYSLDVVQPVSIEILDLAGKVIYAENYGKIPAGVNYAEVIAENLPNGVYLFKMTAGKTQITRKIIKQ